MSKVSNAELMAVAKSLMSDNTSGPHAQSGAYIAERLNQMIQEAETARLVNRAATGITGLVGRFKESSASADGDIPLPRLSHIPPTAKALQVAGLTFQKIREKDPTLTGKELVLAKVVNHLDDAKLLGASDFRLFVTLVGKPSDIVTWSTSAHTDFFVPIKFSFATWYANRDLLSPADLNALQYNLGMSLSTTAHANQRNALMHKADWLSKSTQEEWIQSNQFTIEQWARFFGTSPIPIPQASISNRRPPPSPAATPGGRVVISAGDPDMEESAGNV